MVVDSGRNSSATGLKVQCHWSLTSELDVQATLVPGPVENSKLTGSIAAGKASEGDYATVEVQQGWEIHVAVAACSLVAHLVHLMAEVSDIRDIPSTWATARLAVAPKPNRRNVHSDRGSAGWWESHWQSRLSAAVHEAPLHSASPWVPSSLAVVGMRIGLMPSCRARKALVHRI